MVGLTSASAVAATPVPCSTILPEMLLNKATCEELRDAVTGFVSFFGTFDIEEATKR